MEQLKLIVSETGYKWAESQDGTILVICSHILHGSANSLMFVTLQENGTLLFDPPTSLYTIAADRNSSLETFKTDFKKFMRGIYINRYKYSADVPLCIPHHQVNVDRGWVEDRDSNNPKNLALHHRSIIESHCIAYDRR